MRVGSDLIADVSTAPSPARMGARWYLGSTMLLLVVELVSMALALWQVRSAESLSTLVRNNELGPHHALWGGAGVVAGSWAVAAIVVSVIATAWGNDYPVLLYSAARRAAPLALAAFLPALFDWRTFGERDLVHVLYVLFVMLALKALTEFAASSPSVELRTDDGQRIVSRLKVWRDELKGMLRAVPTGLAIWVVLAGAAGYAAFFSYHTIVHHRNVLSASLDMGLEDNLVWNVLHRGPLFKSSPLGGPTASHLGFHATWFAFVLAPFYALRQNAETLLTIQAILLGGAAVPLFLLGRRYVGPWQAALIAYCYLFYPGLHGSNLYDFHYLPLGPFFVWFVVFFIESRRWVWATIFIVLTLSVREDVAVGLGFLGGLMLLSGRRPKDGLFLLIVGAAYFVVMKGVVMHKAMGGSDAFVHQYRLLVPEGDAGFSGVIKTILSNPLYTLSTMMERQKLIYFLQIALPFAFLPFRRPIGLWAALPGLLFTLLSTEYPPLLQISFQYTAYWSAQLFPATLLNLRWMNQQISEGNRSSAWRTAWIAALILATLATSYQYGAVFQHENTNGGFGRYHFGSDSSDYKRRAELAVLMRMIPPRAKVVASENIVPQLSNRPDAYTLRIGVFDAEYILFRLPAPQHEREHVLEGLENDTFGVVEASGEFVLAKRGYSTEKNDQFISRMGGNRHGRH
ncbi:MAG TPA: DUF2079 domain-containing protein [Polyangiaceae bacterium]